MNVAFLFRPERMVKRDELKHGFVGSRTHVIIWSSMRLVLISSLFPSHNPQ